MVMLSNLKIIKLQKDLLVIVRPVVSLNVTKQGQYSQHFVLSVTYKLDQ
jgi:hypothetical protein